MLNRLPTLPLSGLDRIACLAVALAVSAGPAWASCQLKGPLIGPAVIEEYRQAPQSLIRGFPQGGQALQAAVTQMATLGGQHLDAVKSIISFASGQQDKAIGMGLAAAAVTCQSQDASIVQRIKDTVKQSGSTALRRSFMMLASDDPDPSDPPDAPAKAGASTGGPLPANVFSSGSSSDNKLEPLADPFGPIEAWQH